MPRLADRQGRPGRADLGRRVLAERERVGLSQAEAARRLKMSRGSYRQIEGATTLQYGVLLALVRDLGMDARILAAELFEAGRSVTSTPMRRPRNDRHVTGT